jgi:uncharacterized protein with PQ loop repeat
MFFGHTACFWTWSNTLIFYINGWWSCQGAVNCAESFLGFGIVVVQWLLYLIMYILYLIYLHEPNELYYERPALSNKFVARCTFLVSLILGLCKLTVDLILLQKYHWHDPPPPSDLTGWTAFAEIVILVFFLVHYIPQIYETYQQKSTGSISLITLGFMCPGTFIWTIYLALQGEIIDNNKEASNPIVWVPYLIVFVMQGVLLTMGIYYERQKKRNLYLLYKDHHEGSIDSPFDPTPGQAETINW